ncbi:MAG: DUF2062 domain-containing protein [Victivallaceae bacterium]
MNFRLKAKRWFGALLKIMGSGTPDSLARGVALGLFVGFFIIFGLQLVVVVPLAWICRANRIAAVTFTFVTNHVTVFFIYPLQCLAGGYIMGDNYSMQALQAKMSGLIHNFTWDNFAGLGGELAVAFMLGGLVFGLVAAIAGYPVALFAAKKIQEKAKIRRERRIAKRNQQKRGTL